MILSLPEKPLFSKKQLFTLLWPLFVEQLLTVFVGMVDVLMVSIVGEAAMSGVSLVDSVNYLIIQILLALCAGGTVVCAQYFGADNKKETRKTGSQLIMMTVLLSLLIMLLFLSLNRQILSILFHGVSCDVMDNAQIYMFITALSFPFLALYNSCSGMFRAIGNTKIAMYISLAMNAMNVIGNMFCILVLKIGVTGVAIPTLLARGFGALCILFFMQKNPVISICNISDCLPDSETIKKILSIGIPNSIESGLFQFGKLLLQSLVATLGTASIAGFAVAGNLVTYLYLPGNALGIGMLTTVGQCYGAGEKKQAKYYASILTVINYALLAVLSTVLIIGADFWIDFYHLASDSHILAKQLLVSHAVAMIIWPIGFLLPYYFRAIGRASFTMKIALFAMWTFRIGFAYIFVKFFHTSVVGIWAGMYIDWIFRFIIYIAAFRKSDSHAYSNVSTQ